MCIGHTTVASEQGANDLDHHKNKIVLLRTLLIRSWLFYFFISSWRSWFLYYFLFSDFVFWGQQSQWSGMLFVGGCRRYAGAVTRIKKEIKNESATWEHPFFCSIILLCAILFLKKIKRGCSLVADADGMQFFFCKQPELKCVSRADADGMQAKYISIVFRPCMHMCAYSFK